MLNLKMDEDSYYRFSIPAMELEGKSEEFDGDDQEESLSQSISLPSLAISLQEQLAHPEIVSSSTKNQVMSMKEIDEKLNALRRENFDLKLRLYCSSQNKGFPRFGEKYFATCSTQTDGSGSVLKSPKPIRLSQGSQTVNKSTSENGVQTDSIEVKCEDKNIETDHLSVLSVSIQTELPPSEDDLSFVDKTNINSHSNQFDHFRSIQSRLKEQLNQKSNHSLRQHKPLSTISLESQSNGHNDLVNSPSSISRIKSQISLPNSGNSGSDIDLSLIYNQSSLLYNPDKKISPPKHQQQSVKNNGSSECEFLADEIDSKISILSKLSILGHHRESRNHIIESIQSPHNKSNNCDGTNSTIHSNLKSNTESIHVNQHNQSSGKQFDQRSTSKIFDIINRQVGGPINSDKKRDPVVRLNSRDDIVDINQNLITSKPTSKRLSRICYDSENHHFISPDLGIGDSDQDLNSDLKAYIPLGYYQLLRCNLHQLSSHLNYLDNLYRDCFVLQSISFSEYSTEMKPSLTHLNQTINSSRNICKNFTIEDENAISLRLDKIKAKKESMEKAITRQLRKTDKLLRKAKANLRAN